MIGAIPAGQQRPDQSAGAELAGVDEVPRVPGERRVHVGDVDLRQVALVHHRAGFRLRALAVVDQRHDEAGALVGPQVKAPVLPAHLVAVEVEADPFGTVDLERSGDVPRILERGSVEVGVGGRDGRHAVVDDLEHLAAVHVDEGGQPLDLPRPTVPGLSRLGTPDVPEPAVLLLLGAEVAGRDRGAVQEGVVGDAALLEAGDEVGVLEHLVDRGAELGEAPVRLRAGELFP